VRLEVKPVGVGLAEQLPKTQRRVGCDATLRGRPVRRRSRSMHMGTSVRRPGD
jgi:hypothetical protein